MTMPRYYGPGGGLAFSGFGQAPAAETTSTPTAPGQTRIALPPQAAAASTLGTVMTVAGTIASGALAYHGYKRNNSIGWAVGWFLLGGLFWPIAVPVALAQGFAKPRVKSNRRSRRRR